MDTIQTIILSIIEGITEFLPVSSTGHMILASSLMGIDENHFVKLFEVAVQLGAILSVIVLYWKRFIQSTQFYFKLFLAFIPAAVFGLMLSKYIDQIFENPIGVACALIIGGVVLLFIDNVFKESENDVSHTTPSNKSSLVIGLYQVLALFPGVSRSAATIIGGLTQKLSRRAAAEFSFFLAVPTMFAATGKKLFDFMVTKTTDPLTGHHHYSITPLTSGEIRLLLIGNAIAFVVAMLAIRFFISYLSKHGFRIFGIYRIIVGVLFIILFLSGYKLMGS